MLLQRAFRKRPTKCGFYGYSYAAFTVQLDPYISNYFLCAAFNVQLDPLDNQLLYYATFNVQLDPLDIYVSKEQESPHA